MGKKKILALLVTIVLIVTQFSMLNIVSATSYSALTGRNDFVFGVNIRGNNIGSQEYADTYQAIIDAKSLGANVIRIKNTNSTSTDDKYFCGLADIAAQKGIDIMFQETGIHQWVIKKNDNNERVLCTFDEVLANKDSIINYYTTLATTFKDRVKYYQIGNELDINSKSSSYLPATNASSGRTAAQFVDIKGIALGICLAQEAIKAVDPQAKIIVNTSWKDSGFIIKLKSYYYDTVNKYIYTSSGSNRVRVSWDYTGLDFYASPNTLSSDYSGVISDLTSLSEPVIVVEAGLKSTIENNNVVFAADADWLASFAQDMYANNKVKGFINFELYDNVSNYGPDKTGSYHGLIDSNGNKRTEYNYMQALFGGTNVVRPAVGAVDSSAQLSGYSPEYLDESVHQLNMNSIFSSTLVTNLFFNETVSASTNTFDELKKFEFDMYVEDAAAFKAALDTSERTWLVALKGPNNSARFAKYLSTNLITKNGWNHITISREQFNSTEGYTDLTGKSITGIVIGYESNSNYTNPASGLKLAFANFCLTSVISAAIPSMPDAEEMLTIASGRKFSGALGSSAISNDMLPDTNNFSQVNLASETNLTVYDYLEFDYYVENITDFKARTTGLVAQIRHYSGGADQDVDILDMLTTSGWNHIRIPMSLFATSGREWVVQRAIAIKFETTMTASSVGKDEYYVIANICATKGEWLVIPDMPDAEEMLTIASGKKFSGTLGSSAISNGMLPGTNNFSQVNMASETNLTVYDYLEFDYYVENITDFKARTTGLVAQIRHYSGGADQDVDILDMLTTSGWNHIKIPMSLFATSGREWVVQRAIAVRFLTTMTASSVGKNDHYVIANICATKAEWNIIPEMPDAEEMLVFAEGRKFSGKLGSSAISNDMLPGTNNFSQVNLASKTNLTVYDYLEFDYYVENITDFKARTTGLVAQIRHYSGGADQNVDILDMLTTSGWNHIKIPMSLFATSGREWVVQNAIAVKFETTMTASSVGKDEHYTIANICATKGEWNIIPEMPTSPEMLIFASGKKFSGKLGSSAISNDMLPGTNNFSQVNLASETNLTVYDYLEFDYYVENITDFKARTTGLVAQIRHSSGGADQNVDILDMLTMSGWNHIKIPMYLFATSGREWVVQHAIAVKFETTMTASSVGKDDHYTIANICATKGEWNIIPEMQTSPEMLIFASGRKFSGKLGSSAISNDMLPGTNNFSQVNMASETNLTVYDYLEFDYYVENITDFKARTTGLVAQIRHYSGGADQDVDILDMLTMSGWNHIKIPMSLFATSGREWVVQRAIAVKFVTTMTASSVGEKEHYVIANIATTKEPINVIPAINNVYTTLDSIPGTNHTMTLAAGENPYPYKGFFRLPKTLDTSNAKYIEMDIYVSADTNSGGSTFWVSSDREAATDRGRYELPDLTQGWNHVVINASNTYSTVGSYTFKGYEFSYPYFESLFFTSEHPTGGTVRVANISVTYDILAPTDYMSDNVGFVGNDAEFVTFDENDMYFVEFDDAKDISDTRMIELDIFVKDSSELGDVSIEIADIDGNFADFSFSGLADGWNHLAVRLADLNQYEDNENDVDLSNIVNFTIYGASGAEVAVANACAADYVDGDANRDGVVDIKDVVRAKRLAAGATTIGNKLAVSGADYEINALDLTNLIQSVIDTLFS